MVKTIVNGRVAWVALGIMALAWTASAQTTAPQTTPRAQRPYNGIFGRRPDAARPQARNTQSLDLYITLFGAYDDDILRSTGQGDFGAGPGVPGGDLGGGVPLDPRYQVSGVYTGASANLAYSHPGERTGFGVSGGSSFRYYPDQESLTGLNHYVGAGISRRLRSDSSIAVNQTLTYAPLYSFAQFPTGGIPAVGDVFLPVADSAVLHRLGYSSNTAVMLQASLTANWRLEADYGLRYGSFSSRSSSFTTQSTTLGSQMAGAGLSRRLTRNMSLRLGYHYHDGNYGGYRFDFAAPPTRTHDIDAGVDYNRSLSLTRRATIGFGTGSTIVQSRSRTSYRILGNANLNVELARTWIATVNYSRGINFVDGFADPFFSDQINGVLGGLITRRLDYHLAVGYTFGSVGLTGENRGYNSSVASNRLQFALSQHLALYAEHVFYRYFFGQSVALPTGLPPYLNRQGIRFGLTVFVPIIS